MKLQNPYLFIFNPVFFIEHHEQHQVYILNFYDLWICENNTFESREKLLNFSEASGNNYGFFERILTPVQIWPAVLCCFNDVLDSFNGQTVNFILKPPNCNKNLC